MTKPDQIAAEVLVAADVPLEQERAIVEAFGAVGVAARVRMVPARRGAEDLQWLVLATLRLQAFLSALGSNLAGAATQRLKSLVGRVRGAKPEAAAPRVLVLQDVASRLQVVLESELPVEAYRALIELDLSAFRKGPVHYDRHRGRWRSELDESERRRPAN
jgi:hypothetical protein